MGTASYSYKSPSQYSTYQAYQAPKASQYAAPSYGDIAYFPPGGGIYYPPGGVYHPPSGGGTTPTPTPAPVTPPAPSGESLLVALGSIPIAHDGDVIGAVYHNALRDALLQIAGFLGDQATNQQVTINYLPALLPDDGGDNQPWKLVDRTAVQDGAKHLVGWLPLDLPDGITITGLAAFGSRGADQPDAFQLKLVRQSIADGSKTDLGTLDVHDQTGTFNKSQTLTGNDLDRTVDNLSFEYVVVAELNGAKTNTNAKLFGVQVRGLRW
jgi:hypothetical protein